MRVLVAALGSRGDVQPGLALASRLRRAGHEAIVSAPVDFAAWAAELGLPFAVSDDTSVEKLLKENIEDFSSNPLRVLRFMGSLVHDHMPMWYMRTLEAAGGCDAIVSAGQFASVSAAEKLGIPCFGVAFSPTMLRSREHAPIMFPWQRMPPGVNAAMWWFLARAIGLMTKPINASRRRLGLGPVRAAFEHIFDVPFLLAADAELVRIPADWRGRAITPTGPWFYDDPAPLDAEVEAWLAAGDAPVYVGFGSMVHDDVARLTRIIVEGAARQGRRVLMSKGWAGLGEGQLPAYVKVVHGPMPHAKLFPRMAAVVHHGGSGTTAQALRAGVPQVIVPHIMDQFYYAERLLQLGLAPRGIPVKQLSAQKLAAALDATFALDPAPRRAAAERLRAGDGIARAIAILEASIKNRGQTTFSRGEEKRGLSPVS